MLFHNSTLYFALKKKCLKCLLVKYDKKIAKDNLFFVHTFILTISTVTIDFILYPCFLSMIFYSKNCFSGTSLCCFYKHSHSCIIPCISFEFFSSCSIFPRNTIKSSLKSFPCGVWI